MLFRFDPFEPLDSSTRRTFMAMDAVRTDDAVFVYFDVPGIDSDDIELTVEQNAVTVEASRRWTNDNASTTLSSERPQGMFRRQLQLGDNLDAAELTASLENGVLTLEVPIREGTKARTIEIGAKGAEQQIEAATSS